MSKLLEPGMFVTDEIRRSSDPIAHATAIAINCSDYHYKWVALQLDMNEQWAPYLKSECKKRGLGFFTWAQGWNAEDEKNAILKFQPDGHICNPETPGEDQAYTDQFLGFLKSSYKDNGVIFTEGAWGKDANGQYNKAKAQRWYSFVAMPEAFMPINMAWTPPVMLDVAYKYGFTKVAPALGVFSGYPASIYSPHMPGIASWNIWRYAGMSDDSFRESSLWQRYVPPPPAPTDPPPGITVAEAHNRTIDNRQLVNQRLAYNGSNPLGPNAAIEIYHDISQAILLKKTVPLAEIRKLLTDAGIE